MPKKKFELYGHAAYLGHFWIIFDHFRFFELSIIFMVSDLLEWNY